MSFVLGEYRKPSVFDASFIDWVLASGWDKQHNAQSVLGQYPPSPPLDPSSSSPCYALYLPGNNVLRRSPFFAAGQLTVFINKIDETTKRIYFTAISADSNFRQSAFILGSTDLGLHNKLSDKMARIVERFFVTMGSPKALSSIVLNYFDPTDTLAGAIFHTIYRTVRSRTKEEGVGKQQYTRQLNCTKQLKGQSLSKYLSLPKNEQASRNQMYRDGFGGSYTIEQTRFAYTGGACDMFDGIDLPFRSNFKDMPPNQRLIVPSNEGPVDPEKVDGFFDQLFTHQTRSNPEGMTIDDVLAKEAEPQSAPQLPEPSLPIPATPLLPAAVSRVEQSTQTAAVAVTDQSTQTEDVNANKPLLDSVVSPQALSVHQETQTVAVDEDPLPLQQEPPSCWSQFASALLSFLSTVWNWLTCQKPT